MKIHNSFYEKEGWKNIDKTNPPIKTNIQLSRIRIMDWNLETMDWWTTGSMSEKGIFSVKTCDGLTLKNSKPTHWKEI